MQRYYYLDSLRMFCMFYGIFVHVTTLGDYGYLEVIPETSGMFRMETFFYASGFLAYGLLERWSAKRFFAHRLRTLIIPFVVALLVLNPFTLWLVYRFHNPEGASSFIDVIVMSFGSRGSDVEGQIVWHLHLWFLVTLFIFSAVLPVLFKIDQHLRVTRTLGGLLGRVPRVARPLAVVVGIAMVGVAGRATMEVVAPNLLEFWLVRATVVYVPFYLIGAMAYANDEIRETTHRFCVVTLSLALAVYGGAEYVLGDETGSAAKAIVMFSKYMAQSAICFSLVAIFRMLLHRRYQVVSLLVRSIYTVYLFHYFLIYALASSFGIFAQTTPLGFVVTGSAVAGIGLVLHFLVIERLPLLHFLFNGKVRAG